MNPSGQFSYLWTERSDVSVPAGWQPISDADFSDAGIKGSRVESMAEPGDRMPGWAWDLLQVARTAYLADRKSLRSTAPDNWTRSIRVQIPVRDPTLWEGRPTALLCQLLQALTADQWEVAFSTTTKEWTRQGRLDNWTATEVALFSGGLDSTAFAADLARQPGDDVLFIMFYDPPTKSPQESVFRAICKAKSRNIHKRIASQMVYGKPLEPSSRSRGLLYIAAAAYAAAAHGGSRVHVPENGQLALNLPLTPGRPAACSTRSVHPWTLSLLNQLIAALDGHVEIVNPFTDRTKGEVCTLALEAGLTATTLYSTVSCSHPPHKRNARLPYHCGHCYPCLVRRSGLWHALRADGTGYQHDPWRLESHDEKADDLTDLMQWLSTPLTTTDIIADLPLPEEISPGDLMPVLHRARKELAAILQEAGNTGTGRRPIP